jgi:cyclohexa-1,5-dienecarbonyl-CoA hydratase
MSVDVSVAEGIATVRLNHPPLNILTRGVLARLRDELVRLRTDHALRVVLLSGEGKHFSAGADVGEHLPPTFKQMIPEFLDTVDALAAFPQPIVAAVQGRCLGGGFELVQVADLVVAGASATFGQPEILLGVFPPAACAVLPDRCSYGVAAEIVLTGDAISAGRAQAVGLVQRVVPDAEVEAEATKLAQRIARHSAASLRLAKAALRTGSPDRMAAALADAGNMYLTDLMNTEDAVEGLQAFLDKRQPEWKHR